MLRRLMGLYLLVPSLAFAGFQVSSFKKEHKLGENYWNVASALDGKPDTCWMIDPEGESVGQWLEVDLPKGDVDSLRVIVGWDKDERSYGNYARLKAARIELFTQQNSTDTEGTRILEHTVNFEDKQGWQTVDLPDTKVGSEFFGGRMRLTVTEVYEGRDYPYLAISDVLVVLKEMPARISFREEPAGAAGHESAMMVDEDAKTFWASAAGGNGERFRVEAEGFGMSSLGITAGPSSHARPKTVEIVAADFPKTLTLADSDQPQWFELPAPIGYTGSAWGSIEVTVVDTYPGQSSSSVGIAEIALKATNYEGF